MYSLSKERKTLIIKLLIAERNPDRFLIVDAAQWPEKVLLDSLKLIHELFMELVG